MRSIFFEQTYLHLTLILDSLLSFSQVREVYGDNHDVISKLSILEGEGEHKMVRMANLAIVGSHKVIFENGLSGLPRVTLTSVLRTCC
jgi:glucan phosphorylase